MAMDGYGILLNGDVLRCSEYGIGFQDLIKASSFAVIYCLAIHHAACSKGALCDWASFFIPPIFEGGLDFTVLLS